MQLHHFTPKQLPRVKKILTAFLRRYGNGRITHHAIRWFQELPPETLGKETLVAAILEEKKVIGVIVFGNYGMEESVIAVHPDYRSLGLGEKLLHYSIEKLDKVYTRVACDNIPSLKLCFSCGMVAIDLFTGPTGKPTLWLAGGNWKREDVIANEQKEPSKQ